MRFVLAIVVGAVLLVAGLAGFDLAGIGTLSVRQGGGILWQQVAAGVIATGLGLYGVFRRLEN
jgi:hypothetical protein